MSLVHNERTKLTAAWFNTLAAAIVAAGVFAPLAAILYGLSNSRAELLYVSALMLVCASAGLFLHWIGRSILAGLEE